MTMASKLASSATKIAESKILFVSRLRWTVCSDTLRNYFSKFGKVTYANVVFDRQSGWSKNYGFVGVESYEVCQNILDHKPHLLDNHQEIQVSSYTGNKGKQRN